ncbi:hypothetical protein HN587_02975 [Candidatus Woesearchaeota archaeon]|jgi:hypothetical protein|nr:hypothetical protein [Candidatus Woesearchaeota archaeon]
MSLNDLINAIIPFSKIEQRRLETRLNRSLERNKALMGDYFGVDLSNVQIKFFDDLANFMESSYWNNFEHKLVEQKVEPTGFNFNLMFYISKFLAVPIIRANALSKDHLCAKAVYARGNIFFPTGLKMRHLLYSNFVDPIMTAPFDPIIVHELAHAVWDLIHPESYKRSDRHNLWYEGFAVFCSTDLFNGDHSRGNKYFGEEGLVYSDGLELLRVVTKSKGVDVMTKVPIDWRLLDQEIITAKHPIMRILSQYAN